MEDVVSNSLQFQQYLPESTYAININDQRNTGSNRDNEDDAKDKATVFRHSFVSNFAKFMAIIYPHYA